MTVQEATWLREDFNLVYRYRRSEDTRDLVNSTFRFNNKPVFFYIETLIRFSADSANNYLKYYRKSFAKDVGYFSNAKTRQIWKDSLPNSINSFFNDYENDSEEIKRILITLQDPTPTRHMYNETELQRLIQAEYVDPRKRVDLIDAIIKNAAQTRDGSRDESPLS